MSNITPPSISISAENNGEPYPGNTLVCTPGTYNGEPALSHNWTRDGVDISGATNPASYLITEDDVGHVINIRETATYPVGGDTSSETFVTPRLGPPTVNSYPVIEATGAPETGAVVPCVLQVVNATEWSYLNGQSITGKWKKDGMDAGSGSSLNVGEPGTYQYVDVLTHEGIEVEAASNSIGVS